MLQAAATYAMPGNICHTICSSPTTEREDGTDIRINTAVMHDYLHISKFCFAVKNIAVPQILVIYNLRVIAYHPFRCMHKRYRYK